MDNKNYYYASTSTTSTQGRHGQSHVVHAVAVPVGGVDASPPAYAADFQPPPMQQQHSYYAPQPQGAPGFTPPPMQAQASFHPPPMQPQPSFHPQPGVIPQHPSFRPGPANIEFDEGNARAYLTSKDWSPGLVNFLMGHMKVIPYRFFILDDSGSMAANDGKRIVGSGANTKIVRSSRWTEMHEMARFHAGLSRALNCPTEFRFLNNAYPIQIGGPSDASNYDVLMALFDGSPGGTTPLCRHIREITEKIRQMEPMLRSSGQRAAVIIITDGESSDGDVAAALRPLQNLPVWVVIRLCTDEDNVVDYWNNIDNQLELEMDVLDDLLGESQEIYAVNPWVTYAEPLHRLREFGVRLKALDLIDEATLSPEQMMQVCSILLDVKVHDLPHPEAHFNEFMKRVTEIDSTIPRVWSPATRKLRNWIEPRGLQKTYGKSCVIS